MKVVLNRFQILGTIAFVLFCIAIGQFASALLAGLIFDMNVLQVSEALKDPINADRSLIIFLSLSYTLLSFLIIPVTYLLLVRKGSEVSFIWTKNRIRTTPLLLSSITMLTIIPLISVLINLNHSIQFPLWMSELESYFTQAEENARQLTTALLNFRGTGDLITITFIMVIIPGIIEELFFRGIVQVQLQRILKNSHIAILITSLLFSLLHFQFYEFIPRLIPGILLGYIFLWTKNIWYSCAAHVTNNLIALFASSFLGHQFRIMESGSLLSVVLVLSSLVVTLLIVLLVKRNESLKLLGARQQG